MPLSFILIFVLFLERYDYTTIQNGKSKKTGYFFYKNSISIDEGMPSEVALVCFLGEFYRILGRF